MPSVLSSVAVAVLWLWILNPRYGLLNRALALIGVDGPAWLINPAWAKPAVIIMGLWGVGSSMMIYLADLQGIPEHLYEAAKLDGTSTWAQFRPRVIAKSRSLLMASRNPISTMYRQKWWYSRGSRG